LIRHSYKMAAMTFARHSLLHAASGGCLLAQQLRVTSLARCMHYSS